VKSPRKDYTVELKRRVGKLLLNAPRGTLKIIAQQLEVSSRTLNSWKRNAHNEWPKRGVKPRTFTILEKLRIAREWKRQGYPGSRPIDAALTPTIPARLVREVIAALKTRRNKRKQLIRKRVQVRVIVKKPGVVVSMDGATLQKGEDHIVYRDRGSLSVNTRACQNGALSSVDTLGVLEDLQEQKRLPFVYCSDNGSPLCSGRIKDFLDKNYIVHLKSLPRVPQQNGSCENAVKEFKELIAEGFSPEEATKVLNERRKRRQLQFKTTAEFEAENYEPYTEEERKQFYDRVKAAIEVAVLGTKNGYEKRKAEREAILQTLESHSFITRTRGGRSCLPKPEESL
jgi:transposase InsO family protein